MDLVVHMQMVVEPVEPVGQMVVVLGVVVVSCQ